MTIEQYLEWMAFESLEPLDPAEAGFRGLLAGGTGIQREQGPSGSNWMQQKMSMLHYFNLFGKKRK